MIEQNERVHEMILKATDALLDWLDEGWIEADGAWNVDRARIHIYRDWYAPYWTVAFTVEGPPWYGDTINVDVEELNSDRYEVSINPMSFADENISCSHQQNGAPHGHWTKSGQS